jgi:hypothetical protein
MVSALEGNRGETKTMLPVIESFMAAHGLPDVTVAADAGVVSEANQQDIEAAGLSFIRGMKITKVPYVAAQWRRGHSGQDIPDGHVFTQPWPPRPKNERRDQWICCQYRAGRARRTRRGIDEQVKKAEQAVSGKAPVKRNLWMPKMYATWAYAPRSHRGQCPRVAAGGGFARGRPCDDFRRVGLKLIFLIVTRAVSVLGLSRREAWWKDAEILMLRHQLAVALRELPRVHSRLT